jgi:hypothetical protein
LAKFNTTPQELALPVDVLEPVGDVGEREGLGQQDAPGLGLTQQHGQPVRVVGEEPVTLDEVLLKAFDFLQERIDRLRGRREHGDGLREGGESLAPQHQIFAERACAR